MGILRGGEKGGNARRGGGRDRSDDVATSQGLEDAGSTGSGSRSGRLTIRAPGGISPETPRTQTSGLQSQEDKPLCLQPLVSGGSVLKNLPAKEEVWVQFLGWEDPLKRGMATHCSILA